MNNGVVFFVVKILMPSVVAAFMNRFLPNGQSRTWSPTALFKHKVIRKMSSVNVIRNSYNSIQEHFGAK